jgi:hypothetical protein
MTGGHMKKLITFVVAVAVGALGVAGGASGGT